MTPGFAPRVLRPVELPSIDRGGGARTIPLVTSEVGATTFLNGITRFDGGAAIAHHHHNCVESVMVIMGEAVLDVEGEETALATFDTTFVPANIAHRFRNASASSPMAILWTYASPDATRTIEETGRTARIDAEQGQLRAAVCEVVVLEVRAGAESLFEVAVAEAVPVFQRARGCRRFELTRSIESPQRYRLLIEWTTLDDHVVGFRGSADLAVWRGLVAPHLAAPIVVEHVGHVMQGF